MAKLNFPGKKMLGSFCFLTVCLWQLTLLGQPPAPVGSSVDGPPKLNDLQSPQQKNAELFTRFQRELLNLAQKLERSDKSEDRERAKVIFAALKVSETQDIQTQFKKMIEGLAKGGDKLQELETIAGQDQQLQKSLQEIMNLLLTDDAATQRKKEIESLEKLLAEAREVLRNQKTVRAMTDLPKVKEDRLAKDQAKISEQTKDLADKLNPKAKDSKTADSSKGDKSNQSKDSKDTKEGKDSKDTKEGKDSKDTKESKDSKEAKGGKPMPPSDGGEPMDGDSSEGTPPNQTQNPNQPQPPGRKQIQDALPFQKQAEKELEKNQREKAAKEQDQAIEELAKAVQEMEKRLKQMREEELLKLLANLESRVNRMIAMQLDVNQGTRTIDNAIAKSGGVKDTPEIKKSQQLADKEQEIVAEAEKTLKLLQSEGTAVAFAGVLEEVRVDMIAVQRRLNETYVGKDTQLIQENILAMLKEMAAALKKSQEDIKEQQQQEQNQQDQGQQKPGDKKLLEQIAELKLLRALQMQVNGRTQVSAAKYQGELASDPLVQTELKELAVRQAKLMDMLNKIATGANE